MARDVIFIESEESFENIPRYFPPRAWKNLLSIENRDS